MITASLLRQIAPGADDALIERLAPALAAVLPTYAINTPLRLAHFLAQAAQETDGFNTLEEYGGTKYFKRYDDRADLGNVNPGDGARYHGRGIFQLTGRANYRSVGRSLGVDLEGNPERAADPALSVRIACDYWKARGISAKADADDLEGVTRKINGGLNGLADRKTYLERARPLLKTATPTAPLPQPKPVPPAAPAPSGGFLAWLLALVLSLLGRKPA
jgi:putative chitinase